jgi:hypothetical protein
MAPSDISFNNRASILTLAIKAGLSAKNLGRRLVESTERLPSEVWIHIFSFLDPKSLCRASQASKTWKPLADDQSLWKSLCKVHNVKIVDEADAKELELDEPDSVSKSMGSPSSSTKALSPEKDKKEVVHWKAQFALHQKRIRDRINSGRAFWYVSRAHPLFL